MTSFQLPAYLLAAAQALPGRSRLEATFQNLKSASRAPPVALGAGDDLLALDPGRRAAIRARGGRPFADAVVEAVGHIRAGQLPVASRDCRGCGLGAVCRFEAVAGGEP